MKKSVYILSLVLTAGLLFTAKAQQIPLYSNYFFTPFIYNPAQSGTAGFTELYMMHRRQWSGIQGSPETSALTINGSLNEEKVGWSIYGFYDQTDIVKRIGAYGNYAYHVRLTDESTLSFGLGAGYINNSIDIGSLRLSNTAEPITQTNGDRGQFDLNFGINFKVGGFQIGAAAPQLLAQTINYSEEDNIDINYGLIRHYVFNTRYDFEFSGDKSVLSPIVMVRTAENVPIQVDAGLLFSLTEYGYVGAMFRSDYAVTGNLGVNLTEQITVGYAYDFSLNEYGSQLGTSHEFMLGWRFGSNKRNERLENEIKRLKLQQRKQQDNLEEMVDEKLEEFEDQQKNQIKKQVEEATENMQPQGGQAGDNNTGTRGQQEGANQGGDNTNNTGIPPGTSGNAQGGQPTNTGYNPSNSASNVEPGSRGYYIVAGVFSNQQNAEKLQNRLKNQGYDARYFQDRGNFYYYVYLLKFDNYQQADGAKSSNMNGSYSGDLWIKIVE